MSVIFNPGGILNVAEDSTDLPQQSDGFNISSDALVRCKNLRINLTGKAVTRDGSTKLNETALNTPVWWIEEQDGTRYSFAGTAIYEDESSIETGLTSAQWSGIQYNAFNDTTKQVFALNGTDRKRVEGSSVYEWGLAAPTVAPVLGVGSDAGLTGVYNVRYTYVRKVGASVVAESNPSDPATTAISLSNQSLAVDIGSPADSQVTHARLYRTFAGGDLYYLDTEIALSTTYAYGYAEDFESDDAYIAGTGFKFTITDSTNGTENTYTWEYAFSTLDLEEETTGTPPYIDFDEDRYRYWHREGRQRIP